MGSYLRLIAFAVQKLAQQAGYELVIEQMQTDRVLGGNPPEMIRRRSVDAVLLYGMVHDFHIEYFKQHSLPYLVLGNCSLSVPAPQVRLGATSLLREITRELLVAGRDPVWFEADPSSPEYHTGQEMLAGYVESIERHARQPSMHLCALEPERIDHVAQMLCRRGLENAALIAEHWPVALLPAALKAIHPNPQSLLYVPLPFVEEMPNIISGPNVVRWSQLIPAEEFARRAVRQMIDCLEGRGDQLHAISIEPTCKLLQIEPQAAMELNWTDRIVESFTIERYGEGCRLRQTQES
jgi:hypothetical protein